MAPHRRALLCGALALAASGCTPAGPAITPREAHERATRGDIVLIDIRTPEEWRETGIAAAAIPIDMNDRNFLDKLKAARAGASRASADVPVALICRTANRSRTVQDALIKAGFSGILDVQGGMAGNSAARGWLAEGLPVRRLP